MVVMRSLRKSWKPAKCRACCCMSLMASMGFGYDPLFVPDDQPARAVEAGEKLTSAQMEPAEKNAISHRGKALRALLPIRGHSAEVGLKRVAAVSIRRSARCSKGVDCSLRFHTLLFSCFFCQLGVTALRQPVFTDLRQSTELH